MRLIRREYLIDQSGSGNTTATAEFSFSSNWARFSFPAKDPGKQARWFLLALLSLRLVAPNYHSFSFPASSPWMILIVFEEMAP